MNSVLPLEDYETRRILLEDYLAQYQQLAQDAPAVAEQLSFDAFVQFSFAYYRVTTQVEGMAQIEFEVNRLQKPSSPPSSEPNYEAGGAL